MPATPPRGSHGLTSPMYVAAFVVRSTMPMQFGPRRAIPWARAISATSRCIRAAASPPSTTPPPGMITLGTPARAASSTTAVARSGLTATRTRVGTSGQRVERRVAGLAVELVVARVDEVAAGLAAHDPEVVARRSRRCRRGRTRRRRRSSAGRRAAGGRSAGRADARRRGVGRRRRRRSALIRRPCRRLAARGPGR